MSSANTPSAGNGVQELIDRIRGQGVQAARDESARLLAEARAKAEAAVSEAQAKARTMLEEARAQIEISVAEHRRLLGRDPEGFWLPECGWSPELEDELRVFLDPEDEAFLFKS